MHPLHHSKNWQHRSGHALSLDLRRSAPYKNALIAPRICSSLPQVADFVDRYMPAYKAYLPGMYAEGPTTGKAGHLLMLEIDENRGLTAQQPACPL